MFHALDFALRIFLKVDLYREEILDHYRNPRNYGEIENPDAGYEGYNAHCGDRISFKLKVQNSKSETEQVDKLRKIIKLKFAGEGCVMCMASASMLSEEAQGKTLEELRGWDKNVILHLLNIEPTPTRLQCALLPLEVLQKAIQKITKA